MKHELCVYKDLKIKGSGLFQGTIPALSWRAIGELRKISGRVAGNTAEIRTSTFKYKFRAYRYTNVIGTT